MTEKGVPEEHYLDFPPHGQILVLELAATANASPGSAVSNRLMKFADTLTPFSGVLIDFGDCQYQFSSSDIGSIAATIAAWQRGWVAPCAIVMRGASAKELQRVLEIVQLSDLIELRIVESRELGMLHIGKHLADHGR